MIVVVTLSFNRIEMYRGTGVEFWEQFERITKERRDDRESEREDRESEAESKKRYYEFRIRERFAPQLAAYLNRESSPRLGSRGPIRLELKAISYGSIKLVLDALNVKDEDLRDGVLALIELFAPIAFNDIFQSDLAIESSVARPVVSTPTSSFLPKQFSFPFSRGQWVFANLVLLVPVLLSLYVCYVAFNAVAHEMEGLRGEAASLRGERSELVRLLVDLQGKVSVVILDRLKTLDPAGRNCGAQQSDQASQCIQVQDTKCRGRRKIRC